MIGPMPSHNFISDGCSGVAENYGPIDVSAACLMHDWLYTLGGDEKDRKMADANLWRNVRTCGLGWLAAGFFYTAVRGWGFEHFAYDDKMPCLTFRLWTRLVTRWGVFL